MTQPPRISRDFLNDDALVRATNALMAQTMSLGYLEHRYQKTDASEAVDEIHRDTEAVEQVLAMLVNEQRERRWDDRELAS